MKRKPAWEAVCQSRRIAKSWHSDSSSVHPLMRYKKRELIKSLLTFVVLRHPLSVPIELQNWSNILMKIISLSNIALYRHGQLFIIDKSWYGYVLQVNGVDGYDVTGHRSHVTDLMRQSTRKASGDVVFNRHYIRRWFYCNQFIILLFNGRFWSCPHKTTWSFKRIFHRNKNSPFILRRRRNSLQTAHTSTKKKKTKRETHQVSLSLQRFPIS